MTEPILKLDYWKRRLYQAQRGNIHTAIFRTGLETWETIERAHRRILFEYICPGDTILDAGCAWGRLLDLLPEEWDSSYTGIDLSPDFIALAEKLYPNRMFIVGDLMKLPKIITCEQFDWTILISMRPMIKRNLDEETWEFIESRLKRITRNILFLEYDPDDPGESIEGDLK